MAAKGRKPQRQSFTDLTALEKILEVGQSLIVVRELRPLLRKIARTARSVLKADVVVLYEYQEETDDISVPPVVGGKVKDPQVLSERGLKRPHKDSAVFKMLRRTKPFYAPAAMADWSKVIEAWSRAKERSKSFIYREGIVSSAAVPLTVNGKKVGVLFVNYRTPHAFRDEERSIIELFANQAAIAIHNADLFAREQQRTADMDLLRRVSTTISTTLEIKKSLVLIAKGAVQLTRTDATSVIHLFDETGNQIHYSYEFPEGFGLKSTRFAEKKGLTWDVFRTGQVVEIANVSQSKRVSQTLASSDIKSVIGVPLKLRGRVIGAMFLNSRKPHRFTDEEKVILTMLAEQAVIVIQNASRYQQQQALRQQAETLRKVSSAISSKLELEEVAFKILIELRKVVEYRKASIQIIQGDNRTLIAGSGLGEKPITEWLLRPISQDRLIARVVSSKKPLILSMPPDDPDWEDLPETVDVRSWVGLPLVYRGETIGLLTLDHDQTGFYTQTIKELLISFGTQAAVAIQNASLYNDARRRIRDLGIVNKIVQTMSVQLGAKDLEQAIVSQIADELECTHCTLFLAQKEEGKLLLVPQVTRGARREKIMTRRFKPGEGLAGWVFQEGKSIVLRDARSDRRFAAARDQQDRPRSMLVAPVKVGDQTIGVISADQDEFGWFSENDRRLVDVLAQQAGIAIQRSVGLELLQDISVQINSVQTVEDILSQIVSGAIKMTNTTSGVIYLISKDRRSITASFQYPPDFNHPRPRMDKKEGLTRRVIATGKTLIFPDIRQDKRVNPVLRKRIRSMIAVPLKRGQKVIGVLYLNDARPHDFTETEVSLLSTLSAQAVVAIENANLFQQEQRRAKALELLGKVNREISAQLDVDTTLRLIVEDAMKLTGTTSGVVHLVDEAGQSILRSVELPKDFHHPVPRLADQHSMTRAIIDGGKPIAVSDIKQETRVNQVMSKKKVRSLIGVPLKLRKRVIGVLYLNATEPRQFTADEQFLLLTLADQAAIAIENARLFQQVQQRAQAIELLQEVSSKIGATLNPDKTLLLILTGAMRLTGACSGIVRSLDETGQAIERSFEVPRGFKHPTPRLSNPNSMTRRTIDGGQPIVVPDVAQDDRVNPDVATKGIKSMISLPLKLGDKVVGVLGLNGERLNQFEENQSLLLTLADQAAIAIQNARLYEQQIHTNKELERRVGELEVLTEMSRGAVANLGVDQILDLVYTEMSKVMDLSDAQVQFAFYAAAKDEVTFPLAVEQNNGKEIDRVRWGRREPQHMREGEDELVTLFQPRARGERLGLTEYVIHYKQAILIVEDFEQATKNLRIGDTPVQVYPRFGRLDRPTCSWLGVPMMVSGKVIGIISIQSLEQEHAFNQGHVELLSTVANQAAVAIENARLYQDKDRWSAQLAELYNSSLQISSRLDTAQVLLSIAEGVHRLLGAGASAIFPYDAARKEFSEGVRAGKINEKLTRPSGRGIAGRLVKSPLPVFRSESELTDADRVIIDGRPILSYAGIPLMLEDKCVGLLFIDYFQNRSFSDEERQLAQLFGQQAASAINNARQYEMAQRLAKIERWAELGQLAGSLAHRIGNKGGTIRLRANELAEHLNNILPDDPVVRDSIAAITRNNQYLLDLSDLLFRPFRASEERLALTDIKLLINGAINGAEIQKDIQVETIYASEFPLVKANRFFIEVFLEIISNAVEAMRDTQSKKLTIRTDYDDDWVRVSFTDTGTGIREEDISKLFVLFASREAANENKHFGFGLWWIRTFLRDIGGDIEVESHFGYGTTFTVRLLREKVQ